MTQPIKDKNGNFWIFPELPPEAFLFTTEMHQEQKLKIDTAFIIHSMVYDEYQFYRITERSYNWIIPFISLDRMYLMKSITEISLK